MTPPTTSSRVTQAVMSEPIAGVWNIYHAPWFVSSIPVLIAMELGLVEANKVVIHTIQSDSIAESISILKTDPVLGRLSPRHVLPVAVLPDGSTMCESAAISLAILETFDKAGKLHPVACKGDITVTRAQHLQGFVYAVTEARPSVLKIFLEGFNVPKDKRNTGAIADLKRTSFEPVVEAHLARVLEDGRKYYLGSQLSAVDLCFGYILVFATICDSDLINHPVVAAYLARLAVRKSFKELLPM
jgi:glutathione S-transferase